MRADRDPPFWQSRVRALIGLGIFFYGSYGFTNWLTGQLAQVSSIAFDWERHVPFLAWTIIPYWTTNLFYAGSLFLCRTSDELSVLIRRLLATQVASVMCYIAFPLKFSWEKPETSGLIGDLFTSLDAFDRPYNQAPSLLVALTVVLGAAYLPRLPRWLWPVFSAWSALVIISTMTTFQHHFIDLPSGALLGVLVLWALPDTGTTPFANWQWSTAADRSRLGWCYMTVTLALVITALLAAGGWLWLFWPALSLTFVALAYWAGGPTLFAKRSDGTIPVTVKLMLAPYLVGAFVNSRIWTQSQPHRVEVVKNVWLGRFPMASDLDGITTVVDMTVEFTRPVIKNHAPPVVWQNFACLDLVAPPAHVLRNAVRFLDEALAEGPVLVCCALGYGRSVAVIVTWLMLSGRASNFQDAIDTVRRIQPYVSLTPPQITAIKEAIDGS